MLTRHQSVSVELLPGLPLLPDEKTYFFRGLPDWYKQGQPKTAGGRVTFTTWQHYQKGLLLPEPGLIGPVVLRKAVQKAVPDLSAAR